MTPNRRTTMLSTVALAAALLAGLAGASHAMPSQSPVEQPGQLSFRAAPEAVVPYDGRGVRREQASQQQPTMLMGARPTSHGPATMKTGGGRSVGVKRPAPSGASAGR